MEAVEVHELYSTLKLEEVGVNKLYSTLKLEEERCNEQYSTLKLEDVGVNNPYSTFELEEVWVTEPYMTLIFKWCNTVYVPFYALVNVPLSIVDSSDGLRPCLQDSFIFSSLGVSQLLPVLAFYRCCISIYCWGVILYFIMLI